MARTLLAVAVCVLLTASTVSACVPTFGSTPTTGRCRVKFAAPYRPTITAGRLLRGQATALCTGPVDSHHATLYLERNTGASWKPADQDSTDTIPHPKSITLTVVLECRPGTWRLRYDVTAVAQGRTAHADDASDQLTVNSTRDCQVQQ
jgi:hypothetical protein